MNRKKLALSLAVVAGLSITPRAEARLTWRDCKVGLVVAAVMGFTWQEMDYGAVQRTYRWVADGIHERSERLRLEREAREAAERKALDGLQEKIAGLRKDRSARVEYLKGALEAKYAERNAHADKHPYLNNPSNPGPKNKLEYLEAEIATLKSEIDTNEIDRMKAELAVKEAALPRSSQYLKDKEAITALRALILSREATLYAGLFGDLTAKQTHKVEEARRHAAAESYLAQWPSP